MTITVRAVKRALDCDGRTVATVEFTGETLEAYCPSDLVAADCVAITGRGTFLQSQWVDYTPNDGEEVCFQQFPKGIGAGVVALASGVEASAFTTGLTIAATAIEVVATAAISFGVSAAIRAIIGQPEPEGVLGGSADQQVYSFEGIQTTASSGTTIPVVFGEHPVGGNILQLTTRAASASSISSTYVGDDNIAMIIALSEGECRGVTDILIDGNSVVDNFPEANVIFRPGTVDQDSIPNYSTSENQISAGLTLPASTVDDDGVRTVEMLNPADSIRVNILHTNGLYINSGGTYSAQDIHYQVRWRVYETNDWLGPGGAGEDYWGGPGGINVVRVEAKNVYPFSSSEYFDLPANDRYEIQVRRFTAARPDTPFTADEIKLDSIVEINNDSFSYPEISCLALTTPASENLRGRPNVTCTLKAIKTERWDGVDEENPTWEDDGPDYKNPSWICTTIARNSRWGLAAYLGGIELDLQSFYDWAAYCDELVDDGQGGLEKRHQFDGVFSGDESAWDSILRVAQCGRGTVIKVGEKLKAKWEAPRDREQLFTVANIKEGSFKQQWLDVADRPTRTEVEFLNSSLDYQIDVVGNDDPDVIGTDALEIVEPVKMFGIVRESHARREAKFLMNLTKYATRVVEFEASIDAIAVEPGDRVDVQHDVPQWGTGGRIVIGLATSCTLDQDVTIKTGSRIHIRTADDVIHSRTVTNPPAPLVAGSVITWDDAIDPVPASGDLFCLGEPMPIVISSIVTSGDFTRRISGITYDERVFEDSIQPLDTTPVLSELPDPAYLPPCMLPPTLSERAELQPSGGWRVFVDVTWEYPTTTQTIGGAQIFYREDIATTTSGAWTLGGVVGYPVSGFALPDLQPDTAYQIVALATGAQGRVQAPNQCTSSEITISNPGVIPPAPANFAAVYLGSGQLRFNWSPVTIATSYEIRRGEQWGGSQYVGTTSATTLTTDQWSPTGDAASDEPGSERFFIRAITALGTESLYGPDSVVELELDQQWFDTNGTPTATRDEQTLGWPGTHANTTTSGTDLVLNFSGAGGSYTTGSIDLGSVLSRVRLGAVLWARQGAGGAVNVQVGTTNQNSQLSAEGPIRPYEWDATVELEIRSADTPGNLSSASFTPFITGDRYGIRYIEMRLLLNQSAAWEPIVSALYLTAEEY